MKGYPKSYKVTYTKGRRKLVLIAFAFFRNYKFQQYRYLINHISAETPITTFPISFIIKEYHKTIKVKIPSPT
jgi:methionine synthase II (cobalamin-independent)